MKKAPPEADAKSLFGNSIALNHRHIEAFRAVMIRGTATEAAAFLHTTQPVISKMIARFQLISGIQLFELRRGRLVPTPEAKTLFNTIERSYIGLEQISQTIAELRGAHSGRVHIGCLPSMGMGLLPKIIKRFTLDYPTIQLIVETVDSSLVRNHVASGRMDLGVALKQTDPAGTIAEDLIGVSAVCVMAAGHHLASKKVIKAEDLDGQAYIALARNDSMRTSVDAAFNKCGARPIVVAETTYAITACMMAIEGIGVAVISPMTIPALLQTGLVVRPFSPRVPVELVLLRPIDQPTSRIAQAFIGYLKICCSEFLENSEFK